jgi:N-methylhydantoinase A/oxoprolinase/acetone carboxylase beta subunit
MCASPGCRRLRHDLLVMQGNGGTMSVDVAARHAVSTLMSGPAAGVKAAAYTALILRVGPESAGAEPGPICYGRGGEEPTIPDANLILGRLNPDALLGVDGRASLDHAREVFDKRIGSWPTCATTS